MTIQHKTLIRLNLQLCHLSLTAPDSCALNCRAVGLSFYATLNRTVIDGTHCGLPDSNRICVAGRCMVSTQPGDWGKGVDAGQVQAKETQV